MRRPSRHGCCAALVTLALWAGCRREGASPPDRPTADSASAVPAAAAMSPAIDALQLQELRVLAPEGGGGVDPSALEAAIRAGLAADGPFATAGLAAADEARKVPQTARRARAGLELTWQAVPLDDAGAPTALIDATQLLVRVSAHAERMGRDGAPLLADLTLEAPGPLPEARKGDALAGLLLRRLKVASVVAAQDVGGQLLARELDDDGVRSWLKASTPWQQMAGAREAGERGLRDVKPTLEDFARRSRPDVATVAAATLGRIGDRRSVPALRAALLASQAEVADAALVALVDLARDQRVASAAAAVRQAAVEHPSAWIRHRALSLLGSLPATPANGGVEAGSPGDDAAPPEDSEDDQGPGTPAGKGGGQRRPAAGEGGA